MDATVWLGVTELKAYGYYFLSNHCHGFYGVTGPGVSVTGPVCGTFCRTRLRHWLYYVRMLLERFHRQLSKMDIYSKQPICRVCAREIRVYVLFKHISGDLSSPLSGIPRIFDIFSEEELPIFD